jgi:hypothetical protein
MNLQILSMPPTRANASPEALVAISSDQVFSAAELASRLACSQPTLLRVLRAAVAGAAALIDAGRIYLEVERLDRIGAPVLDAADTLCAHSARHHAVTFAR